MPTLTDIKKQQKLTNADIAKRIGCGAAKAGMVMQGRHIKAMNDEDIEQLAQALSITFERCWLAMQESYNQWAGKPAGTTYERSLEAQYRVATEMGQQYLDQPRSTAIDGVFVIDSSRQIEA